MPMEKLVGYKVPHVGHNEPELQLPLELDVRCSVGAPETAANVSLTSIAAAAAASGLCLDGAVSAVHGNVTCPSSQISASAFASPVDGVAEVYPIWHVTLFGILAVAVGLLTVSGNLIVIASFVLERNIRQPTNYFIASLAVSDLLIGSVSMPFYTVYLLSGKYWPLGEGLCDLWLSLDYTACLCSIYTVFCITADRYCSVKLPAK
jgi:hypothetical protein